MVSLNGDRPLPSSEVDEIGIIGCLLQHPSEAFSICSSRLPREAFHIHGMFYALVLDRIKRGQPVGIGDMMQALKERECLDEVGDREGLNRFYEQSYLAGSADYYITQVRKFCARRTSILDNKKRIDAAYKNAEGDERIWDPDGSYMGASPARKLQGASFLDLSQREIDESQTLLGDRYLCRGGGMFIVAPSGHGKSAIVAQASILFACGLPAFGIKPARPLRSLVVQAEDDEGDITEMARMVDHLGLTANQRKMVGENTHVEFINDVTGKPFLTVCDGFLAQRRADLLWINPYTAYLGADIKDDGLNSQFLRSDLNPILTKRDCAAVMIHHTPKTNFRDTTAWKASDWMYAGAGAAVLTNWARAYLVIEPCSDTHGVYKFIAAKRGKRIGWGDEFREYEQFWAHSQEEGKILWVPASNEQVAAGKKAKGKNEDDLLQLIPDSSSATIHRSEDQARDWQEHVQGLREAAPPQRKN
jgi:hypothetical protein